MLPTVLCNQIRLASLFAAYRHSELMGQVIIWVLFAGSIIVWCIMLSKRSELSGMAQQTRRFLLAYRRGGTQLSRLSDKPQFSPSPVEAIYTVASREVLRFAGKGPVAAGPGRQEDSPLNLTLNQQEIIRGTAESALSEQMLRIERGMSWLATATTTAPFLGLFGTVWGVMSAFQGMMGQGTVLLANVAPGISGALATTVVGLMVALPSAIGYNFLTDRVRSLQVEMENFVEEFMAGLTRLDKVDHGRGGAGR